MQVDIKSKNFQIFFKKKTLFNHFFQIIKRYIMIKQNIEQFLTKQYKKKMVINSL